MPGSPATCCRAPAPGLAYAVRAQPEEAAMDHGVVMFPTEYSIAPDELGRALEERGFESLWFPEHTHIPASRRSLWPGGGDLPREYWSAYDPFVALMAAAGATKRLKLGTGICLVIERDPITTAKEVATLDRLSGGRVLFRHRRRLERRGDGASRYRVEDALEGAARACPRHEGDLDPARGKLQRRLSCASTGSGAIPSPCRSRTRPS